MYLKRISLAIIFLSIINLSGCAQSKIIIKDDVTVGSIGNKAVIVINDVRPESDKNYTIGSIMVFSEDYGIWTLGDDMFSPTTLAVLKRYINNETSKWKVQPSVINLKLKRLKFEANHQADLLAAGSTQLGPLGVVIAEAMHGKDFEMQYDKTRPFVMGFINADVEIKFDDGKVISKSLSAAKAENFSSHMDHQGRADAASKTIKALYSTFSKAL